MNKMVCLTVCLTSELIVLLLVILIYVDPVHQKLYDNLLICGMVIFSASFICYVMSSFYRENDMTTEELV